VYVQTHPGECVLKETGKKLMLKFEGVKNLDRAMDLLRGILD
jgi:hypothetical protein